MGGKKKKKKAMGRAKNKAKTERDDKPKEINPNFKVKPDSIDWI